MAARYARFVLLFTLQTFIFNVNGLTLPLQAFTTKCESFTKPKPKEANVRTEKIVPENGLTAPAVSIPTDFSYSPFIPADLNAELVKPGFSNHGDLYMNPQESFVNVPLLLPIDPFSSQSILNNADYRIHLLPTSPDVCLNSRNSMMNAEPLVTSTRLSGNTLTPPKPSGLKLPMTVSSTVTSLPISNSAFFRENNDCLPEAAPISRNFLPVSCITSPSGLTQPVTVTSTTPSFEPMCFKENVPSCEITNNLATTSKINTMQSFPFHATDFVIPQIIPNLSASNRNQPVLSPSYDATTMSLQSSGITLPISVSSPVNLVESPLVLKTNLEPYAINSNLPYISCTDFSSNGIVIPHNHEASNLRGADVSESAFNFESSLTPNSPLRDFLNKVMPQTMSLLSTKPQSLIEVPYLAKGPLSICEKDLNVYSVPMTLTTSFNDFTPLPMISSTCNNSNYVASISLESPTSGLTLPISTACTVTPLKFLTSKTPASDNVVNNFNIGSCSLNTELKKSEIPDKTNMCLLPLSSAFPTNYFETPAYISSQIPKSSNLFLPGSTQAFSNENNYPNVMCDSTTSDNLLRSQINCAGPCYFDPYVPTSPITNEILVNPSSDLPSINENNSIEKYFTSVRSITAKLNDFISTFSCRLAHFNSFKPQSDSNSIITPTSSNFNDPHILSFAQEMSVPLTNIVTSPTSSYYDTFLESYPFYADTITVPKVPQIKSNANNFPNCDSLIYYNNLQDSLSSLSYSNLLYPCDTLPPNKILSNPDVNFFAFDNYLPFISTPVSFIPENPFSMPPASCTRTSPSSRKKTPSRFSFIPEISTNFDECNTNVFIPDLLSAFGPKANPGVSYPKKPYPYLSSVSINTTPNFDNNMLSEPSIYIPIISTSAVSANSSNVSLLNLSCKEIERMIDVLELLMILDGEVSNGNVGLNTVVSSL